MTYATYEFYTDTWGGKLTEAEFDRYSARARYLLDSITKGRIPLVWDNATDDQRSAVSMALCALIDQHVTVENSDKQVASESIGSYSVSYASTKSATTRMRDIVRPFLYDLSFNGVSLLYRGLEEGRCRRCV